LNDLIFEVGFFTRKFWVEKKCILEELIIGKKMPRTALARINGGVPPPRLLPGAPLREVVQPPPHRPSGPSAPLYTIPKTSQKKLTMQCSESLFTFLFGKNKEKVGT